MSKFFNFDLTFRCLLSLLFSVISGNIFAQGHVGDKTITVGSTVSLSVPSTYADIQKKYGTSSYYWTSDNSSCVSVSSSSTYSATIKGISVGTTRVYYKATYYPDGWYRSHEMYWEIKVIDNSNPDIPSGPTSISINPNSLELIKGENPQLYYYSNSRNKRRAQSLSFAASNGYRSIGRKRRGSPNDLWSCSILDNS